MEENRFQWDVSPTPGGDASSIWSLLREEAKRTAELAHVGVADDHVYDQTPLLES